ncbi:hypothetical protein Tco_0878073 [Tanacetum coccineum]|uniref:Uncharacterized protein n=1 Tax=Tanacetum coccineum TaxID=301880 RepID=A0ABQ5BZW2_9ASTR
MENEHELSYETLTRVYLGSYEHYKGVVAEVEHSKPGFELQGAKMVEMGRSKGFLLMGLREEMGGASSKELPRALFIGGDMEVYGSRIGVVEVIWGVVVVAADWSKKGRAVGFISRTELFKHGYVDGFLQSLRLRGSNVSFNALRYFDTKIHLPFLDSFEGQYLFVRSLFNSVQFPLFATGISLGSVFLLELSEFDNGSSCAFELRMMPSLISCRLAPKVMTVVSGYNVVEEEDGEQICFLGGNSSSGIKKYRGSNSSDGGNTGDGVKIAGEVIGSGDEIEMLPDEARSKPMNEYIKNTSIDGKGNLKIPK